MDIHLLEISNKIPTHHNYVCICVCVLIKCYISNWFIFQADNKQQIIRQTLFISSDLLHFSKLIIHERNQCKSGHRCSHSHTSSKLITMAISRNLRFLK